MAVCELDRGLELGDALLAGFEGILVLCGSGPELLKLCFLLLENHSLRSNLLLLILEHQNVNLETQLPDLLKLNGDCLLGIVEAFVENVTVGLGSCESIRGALVLALL